MQMTPPTTLTMCPSCERVAVPPSAVGPSAVDPTRPKPTHQMAPAHHRPIHIHPWAPATSFPHGPFDALRP